MSKSARAPFHPDPEGILSRTVQSQVEDPAVGAILYHCVELEKLLTELDPNKYPRATFQVADVYLRYARHLRKVVEQHHKTDDRPLGRQAQAEVRDLARAVRELYRRTRYLQASTYENCPSIPAGLVAHLVSQHWPAMETRCTREQLVLLVRPRWDYNATYLSLIDELEKEALGTTRYFDSYRPARLDSERNQTFLQHLCNGEPCPTHIALFSVARLDMDDTLMVPLLAHETAHMFDTLATQALTYSDGVLPEEWRHARRQVELAKVVESEYDDHVTGRAVVNENARKLSLEEAALLGETVLRCLSEIAADLTATRMMGLSYFFALAEYLKPESGWPEQFVRQGAGYPGIMYRLRLVWNELTEGEGTHLLAQLATLGDVSSHARRTAEYLNRWEARLTRDMPEEEEEYQGIAEAEKQSYLDDRVQRAIPALQRAVRCAFPVASRFDPRVAQLTDALARRDRPHGADGWEPSFADITAAAWMYQTGEGDTLEETKPTLEEQAEFYRETCNLVREALKTLPEVSEACEHERLAYEQLHMAGQ